MKQSITYNRQTKGKISIRILLFIFSLFVSLSGFGQVSYRVGLDSDNKTYRLYMRSSSSYTGLLAKISTAQITLVVPHEAGNKYFQPTNIKGKIVGVNQMQWGISRVDSPIENPTSDYISFGFSGSGSAVLFDINANQEIELLSFENAGVCSGAVSLISSNDPFLPPNSKNTNPYNQITILGYGIGNAYSGNYGSNTVSCQPTSPDLTVEILGSSTITADVSSTFNILVKNIGSVATNGQVSISTTLPVGLSYQSFSGAAWSIIATPQPNGTTIITAFSNNTISVGGSLPQLSLNVIPSSSIGDGNTVVINSTVSGGGESNLSNNTANKNATIVVNAPNLALSMTGPASIGQNGSANYSLNLSNIGNSASVGAFTASVIVPNGLSYNSFTGNGWSYVSSTLQNGGAMALTFTNSTVINANTSANTLILNLTAGSNTTNNMTLTVAASVSGGGDTSSSNNTASVNTVVQVSNSAILTLNVIGSNSIIAGVSNSFTINVSNTGANATVGQVVTSTILPAGFIYNSFIGAGWSMTATNQSNGTTLLTATYNGSIGVGGAATPLVINTITQASLGNGTAYTIATTASGGGTVGTISNNYNLIVLAPANLSLQINGINNISAGGNGTYVFTITNTGTTASSGLITQTITLPVGVNYNSFTGNGWNFLSAVPQSNGTTLVTFSYGGIIAANSSAPSLSLNLSFTNNLVINSSLIINGNLTGVGVNFNSIFNLFVVSAPVSDLSLSINGTTNTSPNGSATYTVTVSNTGTASSTGPINVSLVIPNGLSYTSFTGNGWSYVSSSLQTGGAILVTFISNSVISAGGSANSLVVNLTAGANVIANTTFTISGNVSGGGEINTSNNSAVVNLSILSQTNPILTAIINGATNVNVNLAYNYTINVSNIGAINTNGTTIVNTILPAGIIYNYTSGNGWTSVAIPQPNGTTLIVSSYNNVIQQNGTANGLVLNLTPSGIFSAGTTFIINGSVTGGGAINTGNNTFFTTITINSSVTSTADLGVSVNINNSTPNLGQSFSYTFNITNNGTGTPNNVLTHITLPAGFVISNFSTANGGYDINTGVWNIGTISSGQTFSLTVSGYATIEGIDFAIIKLIFTSLQDNFLFNNTAKVCYATPVSLCQGESYTAYLGKQNTNIQWFKNGIAINNANADSLLITSTGLYSARYTNNCNETIVSPAVSVISGASPNAPSITTNQNTICGNESVRLSASSCGLGKLLWSTGATASSITVSSPGTYTATCQNACGTSIASNPIIISVNCQNIGKIGDYVWYDSNNNGRQDAGEVGVKNIKLELYKDGSFTGLTTTTDSTGKYYFTNLGSGNYQVKILSISFPTNYILSKKSNAINVVDSLDSDFEYQTGMSPVVVINTSTASQAINLSIDGGLFYKPQVNISDPCKCFGVEYLLNEKKELYETVTVNGPTNETWKIIQQTGMLALDSLIKRPVIIGTTMIEVSPGRYQFNFTHEDNVGYSLKVSNGTDTLSISNFCSIYPNVSVTQLDQTICRNAAPIPLTVSMSLPGTAQYYYVDKQTQQKVFITEFDPKKFTSGETIFIKLDVLPSNGQLCSYTLKQLVQISLLDCNLACKPIICVPLSINKTKN